MKLLRLALPFAAILFLNSCGTRVTQEDIEFDWYSHKVGNSAKGGIPHPNNPFTPPGSDVPVYPFVPPGSDVPVGNLKAVQANAIDTLLNDWSDSPKNPTDGWWHHSLHRKPYRSTPAIDALLEELKAQK